MPADSYTRYPRPLLWLVRGGSVTIEGAGEDARPGFTADVRPFYISKLPVTNLQYEAYDPSHRRRPVCPGDSDPAVGVRFEDAAGYCAWYAEVSRKPMRLPTEIEWEYACRGDCPERWFFGADPAAGDEFLWDADNSKGRLPSLEDKPSNPFGLYGMLGGVWEWTASLYLPYPATEGDGRDDPHATGPRVLRGGSFRTARSEIGSGVRLAADPATDRDDAGFRIARSLHRDPL